MERCLDCNGVLTTEERVCPNCSATVANAGVSLGEVLARMGMVLFYSGLLAFLVARLAPGGINFIGILVACTAIVLVFMRKKILSS
jgi:hypothetical protein